MITRSNVDLATLTTFHLHAVAPTVVDVETVDDVITVVSDIPHAPVLGGGSNVLVVHDVPDPIMCMRIMGRSIVSDNGQDVVVRFGAGENWHDSVAWCVQNGLGGLENLALIPGTVGAAPMQNIGAYGTEQQRCFVELEVVDRLQHRVRRFTKDECRFGYRDSVFKREERGTSVIVGVTYQLTRQHVVDTSYADVRMELEQREITVPTISDVFDAVVAVRQRKLPDPAFIGNAGSFFKNPVLPLQQAQDLAITYPDMPQWKQADGTVKIPAAWLIDQCGWKGYRRGAVGVHDRQALVLVHLGGGTGRDVLQLATDIADSVQTRFGVRIEPEVNVW